MEHTESVRFWIAELDRVLDALPACRLHDLALPPDAQPEAPRQYGSNAVLNWPYRGKLRYEVAGRWRRFTTTDLGYARAGSWKRRAEDDTIALAKISPRAGELLLVRNDGGSFKAALRYPLGDAALAQRYEAACTSRERRELRIRTAVSELLLVARDLLASDSGASPSAALFAAAAAYVEDHLVEDLDRATVARFIGCHQSHLSRLFREHAGEGFTPWLRKRRMQLVTRLLIETDMSVAEIAAASGFGTATWLIRCFRAVYQTTPQRWRIAQPQIIPRPNNRQRRGG